MDLHRRVQLFCGKSRFRNNIGRVAAKQKEKCAAQEQGGVKMSGAV